MSSRPRAVPALLALLALLLPAAAAARNGPAVSRSAVPEFDRVVLTNRSREAINVASAIVEGQRLTSPRFEAELVDSASKRGPCVRCGRETCHVGGPALRPFERPRAHVVGTDTEAGPILSLMAMLATGTDASFTRFYLRIKNGEVDASFVPGDGAALAACRLTFRGHSLDGRYDNWHVRLTYWHTWGDSCPCRMRSASKGFRIPRQPKKRKRIARFSSKQHPATPTNGSSLELCAARPDNGNGAPKKEDPPLPPTPFEVFELRNRRNGHVVRKATITIETETDAPYSVILVDYDDAKLHGTSISPGTIGDCAAVSGADGWRFVKSNVSSDSGATGTRGWLRHDGATHSANMNDKFRSYYAADLQAPVNNVWYATLEIWMSPAGVTDPSDPDFLKRTYCITGADPAESSGVCSTGACTADTDTGIHLRRVVVTYDERTSNTTLGQLTICRHWRPNDEKKYKVTPTVCHLP